MKFVLPRERGILTRLWLDALRGVAADYYPPELRDYNMLLIGFFVTNHVLRGHKPPTTSRIARELNIPRTTVTRLLQRMERAGVLRRQADGYNPTNLPNIEHGIQHRVSLVLRAAKELTEIGRQNHSNDGQRQHPPVTPSGQ